MGRPASSEMSSWIAWICSTISLMSSLTWNKDTLLVGTEMGQEKIFSTLLLMLETAPLQPCSSLLLLEVDALAPDVSSEVFRASAGLHEAETLVLQQQISPTDWFDRYDTLILLSCSPTSPRPTNGVGAFWPAVAAPFPHHHPHAGPPIPVEGRGKILGGRGGSLQEVPTNMICPLSPCYLDTFTHTWKTSTGCKRERGRGEGGIETHL